MADLRVPRLGDSVHYVMDRGRAQGQCRAATIVRVWTKGTYEGSVQLSVHTDFANDFNDRGDHGADGRYWATSVQQKLDGSSYSYHYPESCPTNE